jgi:hypothetical protein
VQPKFFSKISDFHGGEYEDDSLFGILQLVVSYKLTDVSEVLTAAIIRAMSVLMMEAVSTSETKVNFYETTRRIIPEGCHVRN